MDSINTQWQPDRGFLYLVKPYRKALAASIILIVGLVYAGYRWRLHQQARQTQIAAEYAQILPSALQAAPPRDEQPSLEKLTPGKTADPAAGPAPVDEAAMASAVIAKAEQFIRQNSWHSYGVLAAMQWAKYWVEHQDHGRAAAQLAVALEQARDPNLRAILRLRLATLQWQLNQPELALTTLEAEQDVPKKESVWWAQLQYLRANILREQHDLKGASAAYQQALAAIKASAPSPLSTLQQDLIKMQLNEVAEPEEHAK